MRVCLCSVATSARADFRRAIRLPRSNMAGRAREVGLPAALLPVASEICDFGAGASDVARLPDGGLAGVAGCAAIDGTRPARRTGRGARRQLQGSDRGL